MPHRITSILIDPALNIMRDRRNTNLSTSSTSSSDAPLNSSPTSSASTEKQASSPVDDLSIHDKGYRPSPPCRSHLIYRIASLFCIVIFIIVHTAPLPNIFQHTSLVLLDRDGQVREHPLQSTHPERIDFVDATGQHRWTASIPADAAFPLERTHYDSMCRLQSQSASSSRLSLSKVRPHDQHAASSAVFMDVDEAQAAGVLATQANSSSDRVCRSSLTLSIDPEEASFGKTLLLLWLSYGLATIEGRSFFVDDSRWVYGRLDSFFPPLPDPGCEPPASQTITPCPLNAKHVLLSTATARWSLQPRLDALTKSWTRPLSSTRKIYDVIRIGYQALFNIIGDDKSYAQDKVSQLRRQASSQQQPFVGMHIRRGDLHPFELQFSQDYLPLEKYTAAAKSLLLASTSSTGDPFVVLASDDPDLINTKELSLAASPLELQKAQDRIQLATKAALDEDSPSRPIRAPGSAYVKHVDENTGWDGGFYAPLFFSLGRTDPLRNQARSQTLAARTPSDNTMRMRELVGRSYLLDLEVLSHADGVVCAVSSAACRVLGVMMGWDAVQSGRWINVDDGRPWSWNGSR